jgi:hypothetical protein
MLERADSPWYPSVRLFRQWRLDDWNSVFADMADVLGAILAGRKDQTAGHQQPGSR